MTFHHNLTTGIAHFLGLGRCLRGWRLCAVML